MCDWQTLKPERAERGPADMQRRKIVALPCEEAAA